MADRFGDSPCLPTWFLRKATASSLEHRSVCHVQSLRCGVLVCHAVDTASLATCFLLGRLFGVATLVGFGEKRCRKNLPLCAASFLMNRREIVSTAMDTAISQLDAILNPLGFVWHSDGVSLSHNGPFAHGHYVESDTRIGLSCRDGIDNIIYMHSFITKHHCSTETEKYCVSHSGLMRYLGDVDTCHLVTGDDIPNVVVARDGGNALDALLYDLTNSFVPLFRDRLDDFHNAMRQGSRSYDIA